MKNKLLDRLVPHGPPLLRRIALAEILGRPPVAVERRKKMMPERPGQARGPGPARGGGGIHGEVPSPSGSGVLPALPTDLLSDAAQSMGGSITIDTFDPDEEETIG